MTPRATYRVQFHSGFTFADAAGLAPYFAALSISHLYASPILAARAGSMHGYDVIDPAKVNPELGGEEGFRAMATALRAHDIGILVDIVPNHMAVGGADNLYWLDLLEKGRDSIFANLFDIDWEPAQPNLRDKVLVPLLGRPLADAMKDGDITLIWADALGKFAFSYGEHLFPLRPEDYASVQGDAADPAQTDLTRFDDPVDLGALLARQNFRLAFWRDAGERINWRRFFDITGLAALRMEDDAVFEMVHATIFRLFADGLVDGLRIDHVDGLADPRAYCRRLRARLEALAPQRATHDRPYIIVEKILAANEPLPLEWQVDGTTGYDFMDQVSALQHDGRNAEAFGALWHEISLRSAEFETEERIARLEILTESFGNALRAAADAFCNASGFADTDALTAAMRLLLQHFNAYRTYATGDSTDPAPGPQFEAAVSNTRRLVEGPVAAGLDAIALVMRGGKAELQDLAKDAVRRFNQLAAPVAAKAVEDTAFYRYGRLISRNDVGFIPSRFASQGQDFIGAARARGRDFPTAMLTTATHDHKRGEDVRARLAALSELPDLWKSETCDWFALNTRLRDAWIEPADEYQLYQTLVGCWPFGLRAEAHADLRILSERIVQWQEKSLREAKLHTSWTSPDSVFETANADFVRAILDPDISPDFLFRLSRFAGRLAHAGALNSIGQCVLRYTCPGVPDLYQGSEFWDLSLVDPDNRRPVDFSPRVMRASQDGAASPEDWKTGAVKQSLIRSLLSLRKTMPDAFAKGDLQDVTITGPRSDNVVAFTRDFDGTTLLVAVPHLCAAACWEVERPLPSASFWCDTALAVPDRNWSNALKSDLSPVSGLDCASLFATFPAAVLVSRSRA